MHFSNVSSNFHEAELEHSGRPPGKPYGAAPSLANRVHRLQSLASPEEVSQSRCLSQKEVRIRAREPPRSFRSAPSNACARKIILQRTLPSKKLPSAGQDSRKFADWYDWNNAHCGFFPYIQKYYDTTVYLAFFCCYISNERHWEAVQPLFSLGSRTTPFSLGSRTTPFFIGKPYNPFFHWELQ